LKAGHCPAFLLFCAIPYTRHRESAGTACRETHHLDQALAVFGHAVMFFEWRVVIVGIAA
jgi:hypothetical protein